MEQKFQEHIQTLEFKVYLQNKEQKFKPSEVTEFLGQVHKDLKSLGGQPLSLVVISGYESALEGDEATVNNLAIIQGAYMLTSPNQEVPAEIHYYNSRLAEKFGSSFLIIPPTFSVVIGLAHTPN